MKKNMSGVLKLAFAVGAFTLAVNPSRPELVSTEQILQQSDRERVEAFMQRGDVESKLKTLGVAPEFAKQRVDALTDEEVRHIAGKLDTLPAGAAISTTEWILIVLIAILVVIAL
jgi:hypothetical protein